jgi:hypothetical protein
MSASHLLPHEVETIRRLRALGHSVTVLVPSNIPGDKTPDILMGDETWEMKSPLGAGERTIDNQLREAARQSPRLVLDLARTALDDDAVIAEIRARLGVRTSIERVLVLRKDATEVLLIREP